MALSRGPITGVGALSALIVALVSQTPAVTTLAWVVLSALGLSLMLQGTALRLIACVVVLVSGIATALVLWDAGQWWLLLPLLGMLFGGVLMAWRGPGWARRAHSRSAQEDWWKQMDAGEDPTLGEADPR